MDAVVVAAVEQSDVADAGELCADAEEGAVDVDDWTLRLVMKETRARS